jgi:phosphoserine aminotransferase
MLRTVAARRAFSSAPKPTAKPASPNFGSGPCKKRPGWSVEALKDGALGRSHRSALGKAKLAECIAESKRILGVPSDYHLGIVPASDTGAYEMAMWSLLGPRPVDVCHWESFGKGWYGDITTQLKLDDVREFTVDEYGALPDLHATNPAHDICFTWNGTTSGVRVPNGDWIPENREGLTLCDATSAVFAMEMPWDKLDVVTYSWQKVLGGEGAHGVLVLSPRAVERLETYTPAWPMPKIFRMTKAGQFQKGIFAGSTINTPSMMAVEDCIDALKWADNLGGNAGLIARSEANLQVVRDFVDAHDWISFLANEDAITSSTSICLSLDLPADKIKEMTKMLEAEDVAYDIGAYRDAPPGLRIWGGATVESDDMAKLMPWLKWAYDELA